MSFKNQEQVWQTLCGDQKVKQPKLKEDTLVRLSTIRTTFRKGYLSGWTEELFTVAQAIAGDPPYYKIKDLNNEILKGTFYGEELQNIGKTDNLYKIESILKKRKCGKKQKYLIKWSSFPDSFNSWVAKSDLVHYA